MIIVLPHIVQGEKAVEGEIRHWKDGSMRKVGKKWVRADYVDGKWVNVSDIKAAQKQQIGE
jgi:hypothetical protein